LLGHYFGGALVGVLWLARIAPGGYKISCEVMLTVSMPFGSLVSVPLLCLWVLSLVVRAEQLLERSGD